MSGGGLSGDSLIDVLPGDYHPPPLLILDIHFIQSAYPPQRGRDIVGGRNCKGGLYIFTADSGRKAMKIDILAVAGQTRDPIFFALPDITYNENTQALGKNREIGAGVRQDVIYGNPVG